MAAFPLTPWVLDMMTTRCYVCAEIKAGTNKRQCEAMRFVSWHARTAHLFQTTRMVRLCALCERSCCVTHLEFLWAPGGEATHYCCPECYALKYQFCGRRGFSPHERRRTTFRRRWRLFRWRVTKRRLVERLQIGRVVVRVLPNDLAQLVATYAVK